MQSDIRLKPCFLQEEGGQLTEAVRSNPHCTVLLDEVEKAHPDVLSILLQIMEDGILTDGKGRTVSFKNAILVMTSNVGSKRILQVSREGAKPAESNVNNNNNNNMSDEESLTATRAALANLESTSGRNLEPVRPEEAMAKLQNNPKATQLMLEASSDLDIMNAMRTAMDGSPADLLEAAQGNPKVSNFLERLSAVMEEEGIGGEEESSNQSSPAAPTNNSRQSGLASIRGAVQDSVATSSTAISDIDENNSALYPKYIEVVTEELEAEMKPEFLNRIDEIVVFSPLSQNDLTNIADLIMQKTVKRAEKELQGMELLVQPGLVEKVVAEGSANAAQFGARPMRRAAQRFLEDTVSDAIIQGFLQEGDIAEIDVLDSLAGAKEEGVLDTVEITRRRDGQKLKVIVEDGTGGIGQAKAPSSPLSPTTFAANGDSTIGNQASSQTLV